MNTIKYYCDRCDCKTEHQVSPLVCLLCEYDSEQACERYFAERDDSDE